MIIKKDKRKATKAIKIHDGKITHILPAKNNIDVRTKEKPSGGISLTIEMSVDD